MNRRLAPILLAFSLSVLFGSLAEANDEDKAACAQLEEGDECVRSDGGPGVCVPDDSDPVLTCEDDVYASDDSGLGCAVSRESGGLLGLAALALLLGLRRRRGLV